MRNNSILDKLKKYLEKTPRDQIEKDWSECDKFNFGMPIDDFIKLQKEEIKRLDKNKLKK